jgi:hypothetical protein
LKHVYLTLVSSTNGIWHSQINFYFRCIFVLYVFSPSHTFTAITNETCHTFTLCTCVCIIEKEDGNDNIELLVLSGIISNSWYMMSLFFNWATAIMFELNSNANKDLVTEFPASSKQHSPWQSNRIIEPFKNTLHIRNDPLPVTRF